MSDRRTEVLSDEFAMSTSRQVTWNIDTYSRNPLVFSVRKLIVLATTETAPFILLARQSKTKRDKDGDL